MSKLLLNNFSIINFQPSEIDSFNNFVSIDQKMKPYFVSKGIIDMSHSNITDIHKSM